MQQYCSKDNYLSLKDLECFAKYVCSVSNPCIRLVIRPFYEHSNKFYRMYAFFDFNLDTWIYLGGTRKFKNIPKSPYLKKLIHEFNFKNG